FEQRSLDHEIIRCSAFALRLGNDGKIEAARNLAEPGGGTAEGRVENACCRGNSRLFRRRIEPADRVIGNLAVLLALQLNQIDGNAAKRAVGNHRLVDEGDAGDVGTERGGDRGRILRREVAPAAAGKVDDDVLEHGSTSSRRAVRRADGFTQV